MKEFLLFAGLAYYLWGRKQGLAEIGEVQMINPNPSIPDGYRMTPFDLSGIGSVTTPIIDVTRTGGTCGVWTPNCPR